MPVGELGPGEAAKVRRDATVSDVAEQFDSENVEPVESTVSGPGGPAEDDEELGIPRVIAAQSPDY